MAEEEKLVLNGVDGVSGRYLVEPLGWEEWARRGGERMGLLQAWRSWEARRQEGSHGGLPPDADPLEVSRAGWGLVVAEGVAPEVRKGLEALVMHRRGQVEADRVHVLEYPRGESAQAFLKRHGVAGGDVEPTQVPYYLLLVGGPEEIPWEVQHTLSLSYAVGRVAFDEVEGYRRYAESVVAYEQGAQVPNHGQVAFWGPRHARDQATELSSAQLVSPLAYGVPASDGRREEKSVGALVGLPSRCWLGEEATKASLAEVLHGRTVRPAVLFTASHGVGYPSGHAEQRARQGALLCQDWKGLGHIAPEHLLAAEDVAHDARLHGLVAFLFACFGGGTPRRDEFPMAEEGVEPGPLAPEAFVSALPQRLLSHPQGGALAVISHVERAWACSIKPVGLKLPTRHPFRNTLWRLLRGEPVGHAVKDFRDRFVVASDVLLRHLAANASEGRLSPTEAVNRWVERNDARNYAVLGDPAVRIRRQALQPVPA